MFDIILGGICAITIIAFACSIPAFAEMAKKQKNAHTEEEEKKT